MLFFFFFNDTATTEIYTLSLHDALPISGLGEPAVRGVQHGRLTRRQGMEGKATKQGSLSGEGGQGSLRGRLGVSEQELDRKSTRLNSSHANISYAVFCLKKKKQ